jgi:hypothetical protein
MKQVVLPALSLVILLSILASAETETINFGEYIVSFDLGLPKSAYNVDVKNPKQTETLSGDLQTTYDAWVTNETGPNLLVIGLIKSEKEPQIVLNTSELQIFLNSILDQEQGVKSNIVIASREVDGTEGAVTSCDWDFGNRIVEKTYLLGYSPKIDSPPLVLWALSTFPWDNTLRFLKTIHTESTDVPPSFTPIKSYAEPTRDVLQIGQNYK